MTKVDFILVQEGAALSDGQRQTLEGLCCNLIKLGGKLPSPEEVVGMMEDIINFRWGGSGAYPGTVEEYGILYTIQMGLALLHQLAIVKERM